MWLCVCLSGPDRSVQSKECRWGEAWTGEPPLAWLAGEVSRGQLMGQSHCRFDDPTTTVWQIEGRTRTHSPSPRFELLRVPTLRYINTEKSIRSLMLIYVWDSAAPSNPFDRREWAFLMQQDLYCEWLRGSKIWACNEVWQLKSVWGWCKNTKQNKNWTSNLIYGKITFSKCLLYQETLALIIFTPLYQLRPSILKKGRPYMWDEPKQDPWLKNKIAASVFEARLIVCS